MESHLKFLSATLIHLSNNSLLIFVCLSKRFRQNPKEFTYLTTSALRTILCITLATYSGTKNYLDTCKSCYYMITTDWNPFIMHHIICYWCLSNTTMPIFTLVCFTTSYLTKCNLSRLEVIRTHWNCARFNIFLDLRCLQLQQQGFWPCY